MSIKELTEKEYYIVDCSDFVYFPRVVHVIGISFCSVDELTRYMIDIPNIIRPDEYRDVAMWELERFKTFEDATKEAERLNKIPSNRRRAKDWNTKGKYMCAMIEHLPKGYYL